MHPARDGRPWTLLPDAAISICLQRAGEAPGNHGQVGIYAASRMQSIQENEKKRRRRK